jgi:hypothetical protein
MAKAGLPEAQSPEGVIRAPAGKTPVTDAGPCREVSRYLRQSSGVQERCPVGALRCTVLGSIDQLARAHGRRLRLAVLPAAAAATVFTVVGKGLEAYAKVSLKK